MKTQTYTLFSSSVNANRCGTQINRHKPVNSLLALFEYVKQ